MIKHSPKDGFKHGSVANPRTRADSETDRRFAGGAPARATSCAGRSVAARSVILGMIGELSGRDRSPISNCLQWFTTITVSGARVAE